MEPSDGYICYIVNPKSGASSHNQTGREFVDYLVGKGFEVRTNLTKSLENACELANDAAVDHDCAMVVASGGDGTIREVAHGLEGSDKFLLIIPAGTENLLAGELGLDDRLKTIIGAFEGGCVRILDLGCANGKCFTSIVGFGFDGLVIKNINQSRSGHIGYLDYFWPMWESFWSYKFPPLKVQVDDELVFEGRGMVFVGNISRYALGLGILHNADFSDGLLDVCIYKCSSSLRLVKHSVMTALKQHCHSSDVIYKQGKKIRVSSQVDNIETEVDGDPGPKLPVEITVIPQAVSCIVPENAKPAGIRTRIVRAIG